jgi:hypothetical protein
VGLTGRFFYKWFNQHFQSSKNCNTNWKFAQHLYENQHIFGSKKEIMNILYIIKKMINTNTL